MKKSTNHEDKHHERMNKVNEDYNHHKAHNEEKISEEKMEDNHNHLHEDYNHNNHEAIHGEDEKGHDHSDDHHQHHHGNFKELFLKSLPLAIPIMVLSPMMGMTLPFQFTFPYSDIIVSILSTILLIYGGKPFYKGAMEEFKKKTPGMMALVSLGITVSYVYSIYAVISKYISGQHIMDFFFEFTSLILIMLLGHWIEMRAVGDAGDAQKSLAELLPKDAHVLKEDESIEIRPVSELKIGDIVRVQGGENVPADGIVIRGESRVNEALLTGESKPILKEVNDTVIGGSTNGDGVLFIEVQETGEKSFISQVQTLIGQAQDQPSRAEGLANKVAGWLFYIAVIVSAIAFFVWLTVEDLQTAINFTVTTLVIACPHALGLAIPLVIARSTSLGASRGLLVKDREALEFANKADVMILDKTGTLTTGEFKVLELFILDKNYTEDEFVSLIGGIESGSSHPIAQSIVNYLKEKDIIPTNFDSVDVISGSGVEGRTKGKTYKLISEKAYGKKLDLELPIGATLSILVENENAIGAVALGDELKPTSKELIKTLIDRGITPIMATGDNEEAAKAVAEELDIDYKSNQSPEDKYKLVESLKNQNKIVIMVGDGVNDAPSLALADVGVAVGAGTKVAIDSADIILIQSDPGDIESFLELSRNTTKKMKENLLWGAGYNFIAIPLAAGILAPMGVVLTPSVGAILMSLSTVIVAINAMMLKLDS